MIDFPAPVGGVAYPKDFAPAVLFAVLYLTLIPLILYRMLNRDSRTILLLSTVTFTIERIVVFSLRASQARDENQRFSPALVTYMQFTFGMGYVIIAADLVHILRCLLVNPTYGSDMYFQSPAAATEGGVYFPPPLGTPDQPELRTQMRCITSYISILSLAAIVPGIIAHVNYSDAVADQKVAIRVATLRYLSASVTLAICLAICSMVSWSSKKFTVNSKRATSIVYSVAVFMAVVAIYRLSVMHLKTTSLSEPRPLSDTAEKIGFYVFHALPEWFAMTALLVLNLRKLCGTGNWGDYRWRDVSPKTLGEMGSREESRTKIEVKELYKCMPVNNAGNVMQAI